MAAKSFFPCYRCPSVTGPKVHVCLPAQQVNFPKSPLKEAEAGHYVQESMSWAELCPQTKGKAAFSCIFFYPTLTSACLRSSEEQKLLTHSQCAGCCSPLQM